MSSNINTTSTGATQYINKSKRGGNVDYENKYNGQNILLKNLIGCDIKTNIQWESLYIQSGGAYYGEYKCSEIKNWVVNNNTITISFLSGDVDFIFKSPSEAILGDFRLYLIMNGKIIIGCDDQEAYM